VAHGIDYSFTDPNVRPDTKYLLSIKNTTTTGRLTRIDAAAYNPHCVDKLD
jgi:hypothetical protein